MTAILVPVGHYLGREAPDHRVRVGARTVVLPDGERAAAWLLAHGEPGLVSKEPWTVAALRAAAGPVGDRLVAALAGLAADGLLAEVEPHGAEAERFARSHRLRPLLVGLGAHPQLPGWYGIGRPGEPAVLVPQFAFEVWHSAPTTSTLWEMCEALADAEDMTYDGGAGDDAEDDTLDLAEPQAVLTDVLYALHLLLANHAAYVDEC